MPTNKRISVLASVLGMLIASDFFVCPMAFAQRTWDGDALIGDVTIGVLGLFHPRQLIIRAPADAALVVHAGQERIVLERSSGVESATASVSQGQVLFTAGARVFQSSKVTISGRQNNPADFVLAVPKKISRQYRGTLEIRPSGGILIAIVAMDRELAVASVVAAESMAASPPEALKAEAIAARSYLTAGKRRHHDFDFCDTTHCQFLREAPAAGSVVANAVEATRGLVLAYNAEPITAMYTRSCSGRTHTPVELGLMPAPYPYYSVECAYCRSHPVRWSSRISLQDVTALRSLNESSRLSIDRRLGWSAVPSNDFTVKKETGHVLLEGVGQGHGIGLCQAGAKALAQQGIGFREILAHYYPNAAVVDLENGSRRMPQHPE